MERKKGEYPIGTIALYGPDDKTTTKIVVGIIRDETGDPVLKTWMMSDILFKKNVQEQIREFLSKNKVKQIAASDGNMGCPHEEELDFPLGGDCPFCPFWEGKQGSGRIIEKDLNDQLF